MKTLSITLHCVTSKPHNCEEVMTNRHLLQPLHGLCAFVLLLLVGGLGAPARANTHVATKAPVASNIALGSITTNTLTGLEAIEVDYGYGFTGVYTEEMGAAIYGHVDIGIGSAGELLQKAELDDHPAAVLAARTFNRIGLGLDDRVHPFAAVPVARR